MTITEIKQRNKDAGFYFFSPNTVRFFDSRTERKVYEGPGGIYFVSSEQCHHSNGTSEPRRYTVRQFQEGGDIDTVGKFNVLDRGQAQEVARCCARGGAVKRDTLLTYFGITEAEPE